MKLVVLIICLVSVLHQTLGAKILVVFPHIYYSHFKETSRLVTELTSRGHDVTFVSPYPQEVDGYENITEVSIEEIIKPIKEFKNDFFKNDNQWNSYWSKLKYANQMCYQYSKRVLESENVTQLITSNSSFDLVLIEDVSADGLAILSYVFKCPLVVLLSEPVSVFYDNYFTDKILWKEYNDLRNAHQWALKELYREWIIFPSQNDVVKKIFPDAPDLRNILYQTSLVLMPSYSALGNLVPKYPNVKQIGGFHIGPFRELSSKLERFLDNSKYGVIVVSNYVPSLAEKELKTFSYVHEDMLQDVLFTSDVSAVIGHPKIKLLIGDGDVYDTALAISNQVPVLSISNNRWDHQFLINSLVERGMASQVSLDDLDSFEFIEVVRKLLMDDIGYKETLSRASKILQSNEFPPMEKAVFWIEYVLKFHGASNLRSCKLQWSIQNYLIVTIIVLVILDIALFLLFYWIIKHFPKLLRYCGRKIYVGFQGVFKRDKPTISYIKL